MKHKETKLIFFRWHLERFEAHKIPNREIRGSNRNWFLIEILNDSFVLFFMVITWSKSKQPLEIEKKVYRCWKLTVEY